MPKKKTVSFLTKKKKTKTKRPVEFNTKVGKVSFKAKRKPLRRERVKFKAKK